MEMEQVTRMAESTLASVAGWASRCWQAYEGGGGKTGSFSSPLTERA